MIVYLLPVLPVQLKSTCEPSLLTSKTFPESASTETISPELTSIEIEQAADFAFWTDVSYKTVPPSSTTTNVMPARSVSLCSQLMSAVNSLPGEEPPASIATTSMSITRKIFLDLFIDFSPSMNKIHKASE